MAVNPYFKLHGQDAGNANERALVQGWVTESIQMFGIECNYLPRTLQKEDTLFHEDIISSFESNYPLEMYIESFDGFEGDGDMLMNFGFSINDQVELAVSRERFVEATGMSKPLEGDLIHFPLSGSLFEIKFVEHENQFYPNGTLPTYRLRCELFDYSGERLNTGIPAVDDVETNLDALDPYADNVNIENEAITILDFSESNPFGQP